jgi:hypothetical protein
MAAALRNNKPIKVKNQYRVDGIADAAHSKGAYVSESGDIGGRRGDKLMDSFGGLPRIEGISLGEAKAMKKQLEGASGYSYKIVRDLGSEAGYGLTPLGTTRGDSVVHLRMDQSTRRALQAAGIAGAAAYGVKQRNESR